MPPVRVGIDFGTSNSAAAVPGPTAGDAARVLTIDPGAEDAGFRHGHGLPGAYPLQDMLPRRAVNSSR